MLVGTTPSVSIKEEHIIVCVTVVTSGME